ncbi:hypothetical protein ACTNRH_003302 [Vibrio vulnificus]
MAQKTKKSISIEGKIRPNTKQMPWFPDHAPSSLSGMTLRRDTSIIKELVIPDEPERAIRNPFRREHPQNEWHRT